MTNPRAADEGDSVFVTGLVDMDEKRGELTLAMILPTQTVPPSTRLALSSQNAAPRHEGTSQFTYTLRLLDAADNVLLDRTLVLLEMDDHRTDSNAALFSDLFAPPAGQVAKLQLLADGEVVDSVPPGVNKPVASVQQPAAGVQISDTLTIQWTAGDPDPQDQLLFTVQYSHDDGASWHTLALNLPSTPDPVNTLTLHDLGILHGSGTNTARVRVLVNDGYNTAIATSQPFTLADRPPDPTILTPAPGQTFAAGEAVLLQGSALDVEDGKLPAASLDWRMDGIGVGQGADLLATGLASGSHTASLTATDANSQTATTSVSFAVTPLSIPLGQAPTLDGSCADSAYAGAPSLPLRPYAGGEQAGVRLLRSADHLWACFTGLQLDTQDVGAVVNLRVDVDNSGDADAQSTDYGFFVGADGDVFTRSGSNAFSDAGPGGLQAQILTDANGWSAELRIERAVLDGWDHTVGIAVGHHSAAVANDDYAWPYASAWEEPNTWSAAALGTQPMISDLDPFSAPVLGSSFAMTVAGSGFVSGTVALWDGNPLATAFLDEEHLSVEVPAARIDSAGLVSVTTRAPQPAGFLSNAATFVVQAQTPQISALSPSSASAGGPGFTLTVTGSHFAPGAQILWNGTPQPTQFVSSAQVTAQIGPDLLVNGATVGVAVSTAPPDERVSSPVAFEIRVQSQSPAIYLPLLAK